MVHSNLIDWLLSGDPWVAYRTRVDLLYEDENSPQVKRAKKAIKEDTRIRKILDEMSSWPGEVLNSHKSAGQLYHKLTFIADIGIDKDEPQIRLLLQKIFEHVSEEGLFQLPINVPEHFGGTGKDEWAWALCDAPVIVYSLAKLGLRNDPRIKKATDYIVGLANNNGWHCVVSKELGKFRGPGRKDDPCPYATLVSLKLLLEFEEYKAETVVKTGAETLLSLWDESEKLHPYMFFMGNDFRKIKAPYVWYDILHALEVLTKIESIRSDRRLLDMVNTLRQKADNSARFTPESKWKAWEEFEFAQKKEPSRWVTFLATRILSRMD